MTVYLIACIDIHDRAGYARYEAGFMDIFARHAGRLLAVDEAPTILEGGWPHTRTVVLEFPSAEQAQAWYQSDEYQALAEHRMRASVGNIVMIKALV